jgi:hypothetical protein
LYLLSHRFPTASRASLPGTRGLGIDPPAARFDLLDSVSKLNVLKHMPQSVRITVALQYL